MVKTQEQQNVPKLRFPDYSEAWEEGKLGEYFTFKNGVNADKSMYGYGKKFINVLDIIGEGSIVSEKIIGSVSISDAIFEKYKVVYGDILFQRSSETREEVGQSNVYLDQDAPATFGGFVIRGQPKKKLHSEYFHYLLKTAKVRKDMTSRSGGSTRYNIGQESLSQVTVYVVPTLTEQKEIAAFLEAVDKKIGQLERKKELFEVYKKSCMQKLFSGALRFKRDDGDDFPNWQEKRLGEVLEKTASQITVREMETNPGQFPVFGASGLVGTISYHGSEETHIGIVKDGAGVGRVMLCPACSSVLGTLDSLVGKDRNDTEFMFHWLSVFPFKAYVTGSTIPHVYFRDYGKKKTLFPHYDEQHKIAGFLSAIDEKSTLVVQELERARSFKKGLLQQMFV